MKWKSVTESFKSLMKDLLATIYFKEFPWSSLLDVVLNCTPSVYPNNTKRLNFIRPQILDQKKMLKQMNCILRNIPMKQEYSHLLPVLKGYMRTHTYTHRILTLLTGLWGHGWNVCLVKCE